MSELDAIRTLKARYFRLLDGKRWDELRGLLTEDCRFSGPGAPELSRDAFVNAVRTTLEGVTTIHRGSMPELELLDGETARGTWQFDWIGCEETESANPEADFALGGHGEYREEYRKVGGAWHVSALETAWMRFRPGTMARLGYG